MWHLHGFVFAPIWFHFRPSWERERRWMNRVERESRTLKRPRIRSFGYRFFNSLDIDWFNDSFSYLSKSRLSMALTWYEMDRLKWDYCRIRIVWHIVHIARQGESTSSDVKSHDRVGSVTVCSNASTSGSPEDYFLSLPLIWLSRGEGRESRVTFWLKSDL